jgi:hypothetical protein
MKVDHLRVICDGTLEKFLIEKLDYTFDQPELMMFKARNSTMSFVFQKKEASL